MSDKIKKLFSRLILNESSVYKNIIAINEHDMKFLKAIGIYAIENFSGDITAELNEASSNSFLFQQIRNESLKQLKGYQSIFWNMEHYTEGKDPIGYHVASVDKNQMQAAQGDILTKYLQENHVSLYLPILEDWCRYYIKNCNEGLQRRIILQSVADSLEPYNMKKLCIYNGTSEEIVDLLK